MSEDEAGKKVDWVRGPKEADLYGVDVIKIAKARDERGIEVEIPTGGSGKGKSKITKVVVKDMPAPKSSEKGKV